METKKMTKELWDTLTDEEKTQYMRNVFRAMHIGETFDYTAVRRTMEGMEQHRPGFLKNNTFKNPCIVLELFDPVMAYELQSWMYMKFDEKGNYNSREGGPAPIFGYLMKELCFDKDSLMEFTESEREVLREACRIINNKVKAFSDGNDVKHD